MYVFISRWRCCTKPSISVVTQIRRLQKYLGVKRLVFFFSFFSSLSALSRCCHVFLSQSKGSGVFIWFCLVNIRLTHQTHTHIYRLFNCIRAEEQKNVSERNNVSKSESSTSCGFLNPFLHSQGETCVRGIVDQRVISRGLCCS